MSDFHHDNFCPCAEMTYPDLDEYEEPTPETHSVDWNPKERGWLTPKAAAKIVRISEYTIERLRNAAVLPSVFYPETKMWFIDPESIQGYFDNMEDATSKVMAVEQWKSGQRAFVREVARVHAEWIAQQSET